MSKIDEQLSYIQRRKYCVKCPKYTVFSAIIYESPLFMAWLFGSIIMFRLNLFAMVDYILLCIVYIVIFLGLICTYCPLYGTTSCASKFGNIAERLFAKRDERKFSRQFKIFSPVLSLLWILPLVAGIYQLIIGFSWFLLVILILFTISGFVLVPLLPRLTVCRNCPVRNDCPWMKNVK
jgi:hypothetical protein